MVAVLAYLATQSTAVYADAFGFDREMRALVERWRPEIVGARENVA